MFGICGRICKVFGIVCLEGRFWDIVIVIGFVLYRGMCMYEGGGGGGGEGFCIVDGFIFVCMEDGCWGGCEGGVVVFLFCLFIKKGL